jgi:hypothetical protein
MICNHYLIITDTFIIFHLLIVKTKIVIKLALLAYLMNRGGYFISHRGGTFGKTGLFSFLSMIFFFKFSFSAPQELQPNRGLIFDLDLDLGQSFVKGKTWK